MASKIDWAVIQREYVTSPTTSCASLAAKYNLGRRTVEYHAQREHWAAERQSYCAEVSKRLVEDCADSAADLLRERNERQLKQNAQLEAALWGAMEAKPGIPIADVARRVTAMARAVMAVGGNIRGSAHANLWFRLHGGVP
jgi:hypothetical protein